MNIKNENIEDERIKRKKLLKTRNKITAVCTETELSDFIYFIREDTMKQLIDKSPSERDTLIKTFERTH